MLRRWQYDKWLLLITAVLVGFGALMVYSSTSVVTPLFAKRNIDQFFYFKRHLFTVFVALFPMVFACRVSPENLKRFALPLLVCSFILLLLIFIPDIGVSAGGARRWLRAWPSTFQPSELAKLAMVVFLAKYMSSPSYRSDSSLSFLIPVLIMGVFQIVFIKQPDFGAAMSMGILTFAMLVLSGVRLRYLAYISVLFVPLIIKLVMEPYRLKRVVAFLDPWKEPQGSGFQLVQSFIALGSGGFTGIGLGESRQKLSFLPESHTDFIFSLVGEELGFIAAAIVIGLFLLLFIRGILIANKSRDPFVYYLASGLSMMIALQALINFFVVTGLAPTKGLPLPFISYGGSSLLVNMTAIGILLNLSGNEHRSGNEDRMDLLDIDRAKSLLDRKKALISVYGREHRVEAADEK